MFEGLVRQLLLGYLGRYIKDFQKEQLKITFWNEEVVFENVELILEAFDYLQLPVALKRGQIGRLSIKIPWKKLGWDPVIILLEDVFFSAGPRDDNEWSADAVERRELAAKKAKLAAAELAKLSRRICDNQAGLSLMSHVTGRILDNIQVSMNNVHVLYCETQPHSGFVNCPLPLSVEMLLGLRFSCLTVAKQQLTGPSSKVNKIVEIHGLGIYCNTFSGSLGLVCVDGNGESKLWSTAEIDADKYDYVVVPFDLSLLVTKAEKVENDAPQYSVTATLTELAMTLAPEQLQHILNFLDYICTCQLREKYGRYRPWGSPLSKKLKGWEKLWWHYAQASVLSEVRKKLKKTSWRYFGQRIDHRRKYVNLYKVKLNFLRREQPVDEDVLVELEQMEKDSDVDDILQLRSIAERELEDTLHPILSDSIEIGSATSEKLPNDDTSSGRARGWLNWLSRGVLGAGGTDDSGQFSGVVSDDVIKDICEATEFQPVPSVNFTAVGTTLLFSVNFRVAQLSLLMKSGRGEQIAVLNSNDVEILCNFWEDSTSIVGKVGCAEVSSSKALTILRIRKVDSEDIALKSWDPSASIEVNLSAKNEAEWALKVTVQPVDMIVDLVFFFQLMEFYTIFESHKSLQQRVLDSLNGIADFKSRLQCKAECVFLGRQRVIWDVNFVEISVSFPWESTNAENCSMVMQTTGLRLSSNLDMTSLASDREYQSRIMSHVLNINSDGDILNIQKLNDLYDHYEASVNNFEIKLVMPCFPQGLSVVENFSVFITCAHCIIPDELSLKQLEAQFFISSIHMHFSTTIYGALLALVDEMCHLYSDSVPVSQENIPLPKASGHLTKPWICSVAASFEFLDLDLNLEDDGDNSYILLASLQQLHLMSSHTEVQDWQLSVGTIEVSGFRQKAEIVRSTLCKTSMSSGEEILHSGPAACQSNFNSEQNYSSDGCFRLHYVIHGSGCMIPHLCTVFLRDMEIHCYPSIVGMVAGFSEKMMAYEVSGSENNFLQKMESKQTDVSDPSLLKSSLSNFFDNEMSEWAEVDLDQFPFVNIYNFGRLHKLDTAVIVPEKRNLNVRDFNTRSPACATSLKTSVLKDREASDHSSSSSSAESCLRKVDLDILNVNLHFHDSTCIISSIKVPGGTASVISYENAFDVLCSLRGLTLFSAQWTDNFQEFLWGPSFHDQTPVLNLRARKGGSYLSKSDLEISFNIQHVCCVLPPDYLAMLIGYFSLPDWSSDNKCVSTEDCTHIDLEKKGTVIYKFEVLESMVMSPVKSKEKHYLKLDLRQLYGSYIENDALEEAFVGLLSEFSISEDNLADNANSLNIFGRDLCLSLLILEDCASDTLIACQATGYESYVLIKSINFDLWLRFPAESLSSSAELLSPFCTMIKITSCALTAEDSYRISGFEALAGIVDEYSLVDRKSRCFNNDISGFLQLMTSVKENFDVTLNELSIGVTEFRCFVTNLTLTLLCSEKEPNIRGVTTSIEADFKLSATLENDINFSLDAEFSSLYLLSSVRSTGLANFLSDSSASSVLHIHISVVQQYSVELVIDLPFLEIWFHLLDWLLVIDHITDILKAARDPTCSAASSPVEPVDMISGDSDKLSPTSTTLNVKSKNIVISCHVPLWVEQVPTPQREGSNNVEGPTSEKESRFLSVSLYSRCSELYACGRTIKCNLNFDKATGSVGIWGSSDEWSWPLFQLCRLSADIQVCGLGDVSMSIEVDIDCESFDMWFSHQVFHFYNGIEFPASGRDTSGVALGIVDLNVRIKKVSLLLTDGRGGSNGPLLELLVRNLHVGTSLAENYIAISGGGDLLVNYSNIHKVLWEPFVEPCSFKVEFNRKQDKSALDSGSVTDIQLESTAQLNINITDSLFEVILRAFEMIQEARGLVHINMDPGCQKFQNDQSPVYLSARRYASYTIYNRTSLPFKIQVYQGLGNAENVDLSRPTSEKIVPPGSSVPIYIDGMLEEQAFNSRPASSEGFGKKLSNKAGHHFMTIQFEGTSDVSEPMSMDLVGLTYFEVNFSRDKKGADVSNGLLVPVVFDVSLQRYSKLIQLYSTVIFHNSTCTPLELRFDIPFSMSSKILDPIYPGDECPLPLHLAEAGHMRWRPLGNNYLWSEVHNLSNILSSESKSGFLRSLVCYPSHPSSYLFRCCLSVQDINLPLCGRLKSNTSIIKEFSKQSSKAGHQLHYVGKSKTRFIHHVALTTPLTVKSYLPEAISVTIEGGGVSHAASLAEMEVSFFHVDSSHDLTVTFHITGFRPSAVKFPCAEAFITTAKPSARELSLTETMTFAGQLSDRHVYATVEKIMDSLSGARELCISVPFLLYNCTGFPLTVSRPDHELKGNHCVVPSCYCSVEQEFLLNQKDGLLLISSEDASNPRALNFGSESYLCKNHVISRKSIGSPPLGLFLTQSSVSQGRSTDHHQPQLDLVPKEVSSNRSDQQSDAKQVSDSEASNVFNDGRLMARPFMYSPDPTVAASEIMVRVTKCHAQGPSEKTPTSSWSSSFFLVAPSGSTTVLIPEPATSSAAVISVTSHLLSTPLMGRTRAVTFQPRYIMSNACDKALYFKQKGTDVVYHLGVGQHSHLHWIDTTRELLVAVRFDEPGWQWSGSFLPEHLGDTQVKMRNYVTGALNVIRVEVQNADVIQDEKIIGNTIGNSGTNFILLSNDDTGFVPYRIDNFSKETLRIHQQKCETLETIVHPYTSCPYSWDEPFFPHRLIVEVPGERIIGSYTLDDVKEYAPVRLSSSSISSEKHERTLLSSVHAEGATKVLSIIDSSRHAMGETKNSSSLMFGKKKDAREGADMSIEYKDKISVRISCIGISIMDSSPQELLYAYAKDIKVDCLQDMEQQRFSFHISSLQIDNQLRSTPYPVILSFDEDYKSSLARGTKTKLESLMPYAIGTINEPAILLVASKWRNKDMAFVSFEYISIRIRDLQLALDLELLLKLLEFFKANPLFNLDMATSVPSMDNRQRSRLFTSMSTKTSQANGDDRWPKIGYSSGNRTNSPSLPEVVPIGAPWQKIFLLARRQKKIYIETFSVSPLKVTLSFSSNPWMIKNGGLSSAESLIHRGIMAFADVEGAQICIGELTITHHMANWKSVLEIPLKHCTREFIHDMYKVLGSAVVIGNPMGFARRVGLGVKDFISVPARGVLQSPSGLISGMAHGTTSLISNTMYAISDTATQFSKAAHKGVLAFTFDDHDSAKLGQRRTTAQSKGVINELLEGLTGLLQSPIKGAEKHGLPGVLSGFALGVSGLVAKPAASVLEATGRTAQSIRNRSRLHRMRTQNLRVRLPRSLSVDVPLRPYSWEEAIGTAVLSEVHDGSRFRDEVIVMCKFLKDGGKFVVLTEKLIIIVDCPSLIDLGKPNFRGIVAEPEWTVVAEIALESVIHVDADEDVVHIVGSTSEPPLGQNQHHLRRTVLKTKRWGENPSSLPLFQTSLELASSEDADYFLKVLLSAVEQGKERGWGNVHILHRGNLE